MRMTKKFLKILEEIDREVTNSLADPDDAWTWEFFVSRQAKKAGVPEELIKRYINEDLDVLYKEVSKKEAEEFLEKLEKIDAEICQSGIYEVLDETEADDLWLKLMFYKAKEAGISEEEVKKYIYNK